MSSYYTTHLAEAAAAQLQQTSRAEADDTSAVSTESSYVQQQQSLAAADMQQANNIVSSTSVVEERIAGASISFANVLAAEPSLRPTCRRRDSIVSSTSRADDIVSPHEGYPPPHTHMYICIYILHIPKYIHTAHT